MLATGRCLGQMDNILKEFIVDGAILNNGAYANIHGEDIFKSPIDKKIIDKMMGDGLHISALTKDEFVYFEDDPIFKTFVDYFKIDMPRLRDYSYLETHEAYSLGAYSDNCDALDLNKYDLKFVRVCKWGYDIINKDVSKASPFAMLRNKYPGSKIIAFGDNYNDLEMLRAADISIAMGNAPEDVKKEASFVTKHVMDEGIKYAVEEILKIYEN